MASVFYGREIGSVRTLESHMLELGSLDLCGLGFPIYNDN